MARKKTVPEGAYYKYPDEIVVGTCFRPSHSMPDKLEALGMTTCTCWCGHVVLAVTWEMVKNIQTAPCWRQECKDMAP